VTQLLWRVIIAVIAVVLVIALIPPVSRIIGFEVGGDLWVVLRICIAGLAVFYIIKGPPFPS
jgi:hypothetical protein